MGNVVSIAVHIKETAGRIRSRARAGQNGHDTIESTSQPEVAKGDGGLMSRETSANAEISGVDMELPEAKLIWKEYRYRHDLCWRLIFQITIAVVAILVIPYIRADITKSVGPWILALPALAVVLVLFSISRMKSELGILDKIRALHRERQGKVHHIPWKSSRHFTRDVVLYLIALGLVSIADMAALLFLWLPPGT